MLGFTYIQALKDFLSIILFFHVDPIRIRCLLFDPVMVSQTKSFEKVKFVNSKLDFEKAMMVTFEEFNLSLELC